VPWPKGDAMYNFIRAPTDRDYWGDYRWGLGKINLLRVKGFMGDIDGRFKDLKSGKATVEEYYIDTIPVASHESGHALFDELFPTSVVKESYEAILSLPPGVARLRTSLTEGLAIEYERLTGEILSEMVPKLPPNFNWGIMYSWDRIESFKRDHMHQSLREYSDGNKIIRRLTMQLGVSGQSREDRIVAITNFFKGIDLVEVSKISLHDSRYLEMVRDPLNKLPQMKKH
jgi:hypothetical protein